MGGGGGGTVMNCDTKILSYIFSISLQINMLSWFFFVHEGKRKRYNTWLSFIHLGIIYWQKSSICINLPDWKLWQSKDMPWIPNLKTLFAAPDNKIVLILSLVMMMDSGEHKNGFIGFMTLSFGCNDQSLFFYWFGW